MPLVPPAPIPDFESFRRACLNINILIEHSKVMYVVVSNTVIEKRIHIATE